MKEGMKMIRWTRSIRVASVKNYLQAVQAAKEVAQNESKKYGIQMSAYEDVFGEPLTIRWFCDYPDLATLEKITNQINADPETMPKILQMSDYFVESSVRDGVMHSL
jgi:hypothetical protein